MNRTPSSGTENPYTWRTETDCFPAIGRTITRAGCVNKSNISCSCARFSGILSCSSSSVACLHTLAIRSDTTGQRKAGSKRSRTPVRTKARTKKNWFSLPKIRKSSIITAIIISSGIGISNWICNWMAVHGSSSSVTASANGHMLRWMNKENYHYNAYKSRTISSF